MQLKARFLLMVVVLITLSLAALQASLQAQGSTEPAATEEPCISIVEAAMQPLDNTATAATEDPALDSCFEALASAGTDVATPDASTATLEPIAPAATDAVDTTTEDGEMADVYIPITIDHANALADAGRVWVTWHDPSTGDLEVALGAQNMRVSYYNTGLDITLPYDVVDIGIRVEATPDRNSGAWQVIPVCTFAFATPPQGFSISVDDNNVCAGQTDSP